jgi:hypothetical protein
VASLKTGATALWRISPPLTAVGGLMLAASVVFAAGIVLDDRTITGMAAWTKPTKFALSTSLYCFTLAWIFRVLPAWRRTRAIAGGVTAAVFVVEVAIIAAQAWRGTTSHFNIGTPLDAVLFAVMGVLILIQTLAAVVVASALWRQRSFENGALAWALRLGMTLSIAGAATGALMTRPTTAQLEEARLTNRQALAGAHTVGAPDGGPGLPFLGWSMTHGDLRVPHFVGLHAMQALPLLALALRRRQSERARIREVWIAATIYTALFVFLLIRALEGRPIAGLFG